MTPATDSMIIIESDGTFVLTARRDQVIPFQTLIHNQQELSTRPITWDTQMGRVHQLATLIDEALLMVLDLGTKAKRDRLTIDVSTSVLRQLTRTDQLPDRYPLVIITDTGKDSLEVHLRESIGEQYEERALAQQQSNAESAAQLPKASVFFMDLVQGQFVYGQIATTRTKEPWDFRGGVTETERRLAEDGPFEETVVDELLRREDEEEADILASR